MRKPVAVFSLEMSKESLLRRLLASEALVCLILAGVALRMVSFARLADFASGLLLGIGQPVEKIRVERFGPTS